MFTRLSVKLLIPTAAVGLLTTLLIMLLADELGKSTVIGILLALIVVQLIAGFIFNEQQLSSRLTKLQDYLKLVVNPTKAPSGPLIDPGNDELALTTNELSSFISDLSDVLAELRNESESLKEGSSSLSSQMVDSVQAVDDSSRQIELMANSIDEVASTSSILSESASQVSDTTDQVIAILSQGRTSSNTSQQTIEAFSEEITGATSCVRSTVPEGPRCQAARAGAAESRPGACRPMPREWPTPWSGGRRSRTATRPGRRRRMEPCGSARGVECARTATSRGFGGRTRSRLRTSQAAGECSR